MPTYRIQLYEARTTENDMDDVALFDVSCEEDGRTWRVPVFLSPLFRVLQMETLPSLKSRRSMVIGLGARAIAERLRRGLEPPFERSLVFATDYPGAPGDPNPLLPCDQVIICGSEANTVDWQDDGNVQEGESDDV
jgi:hypothetical protein